MTTVQFAVKLDPANGFSTHQAAAGRCQNRARSLWPAEGAWTGNSWTAPASEPSVRIVPAQLAGSPAQHPSRRTPPATWAHPSAQRTSAPVSVEILAAKDSLRGCTDKRLQRDTATGTHLGARENRTLKISLAATLN